MTIQCTDNRGFAWHHHQGVWAKGYLWDADGILHQGDGLCQYFAQFPPAEFPARLAAVSGQFAAAGYYGQHLWAVTDPVRSLPLFVKAHHVFDTLPCHGQPPLNTQALSDFLFSGFTIETDTLLQEIRQVPAGHFWLNGQFYPYRSFTRPLATIDLAEAVKQVQHTLEAVFHRYYELVKNRPVYLSLSGGLDSRLVAYMLKEAGHTNLHTFTYGRSGSKEVQKAQEIASRLDVPWHYLDVTPQALATIPASNEFLEWVSYASQFTSMFFLQDYLPLVSWEHRDPEAVFIPGHSGDFLAGSHLKPHHETLVSPEVIFDELLRKHFYMHQKNNQGQEQQRQRLADCYARWQSEYESLAAQPWQFLEDWNFRHRQVKFIIPSARIYSFLGHAYFLPLWDAQLMEVFTRLPFHLRLGQSVYQRALADWWQPRNLLLPNEQKAYRHPRISPAPKQTIKSWLPSSLLYHRLKRQDTIYYAEVSRLLLQDITHQGLQATLPREDLNEVLVQWYARVFLPGQLGKPATH